MAISAREVWGNYESIEAVLRSNGIPIDLDTNEGINTILVPYNGRMGFPYDDNSSDEQKEQSLRILSRFIYSNDGDGVLLFKPGEAIPRMLYFDQQTGEYALSEPVNRIEMPKSPGFVATIMNFVFGAFKDDFNKYNAAKDLYTRAQGIISNQNYESCIKSHQENPAHMYRAEREAAEIKAAHREEAAAWRDQNQETLGQALEQYDPVKQVKDQLDALYKETEDMGLADRMDYILIDGVPVRTPMFNEYFEQSHSRSGFSAEGKEAQLDQRLHEIVTGALAAGKRVDCYVPNPENGDMPEKPISLKVNFEFPAKAKPFADKLPPLPKESTAMKYARLADADRLIRKIAGRRAIMALHTGGSGKTVQKTMFGDEDPSKLNNPLGFSLSRTAAESLVYAYLANQGYSIEMLQDPHLFLEEKRAAGKIVMEKIAAGDGKWIAEQEILGREKIILEMGMKLDQMELKDISEFLLPENHWIAGAAEVLFDMDQEERHFKADLQAVIDDPEKPNITKELHDYVVNASNGIFSAPKTIPLGEYESACAQLGMIDHCAANAMQTVSGKILFDILKDRKAVSPNGLAENIAAGDTALVAQVQGELSIDPDLFEMISGPLTEKEGILYQQNICKFADLGGISKHFEAKQNEFGLYKIHLKNIAPNAPSADFAQKVNKELAAAAPKVK